MVIVYNGLGCGTLVAAFAAYHATNWLIGPTTGGLVASALLVGIDLAVRRRAPGRAVEGFVPIGAGNDAAPPVPLGPYPLATALVHPRLGGALFFVPVWVIGLLAAFGVMYSRLVP